MKKGNTSYGIAKIEVADLTVYPPVFETLWERPKRLPRKLKKELKKREPCIDSDLCIICGSERFEDETFENQICDYCQRIEFERNEYETEN
jgi:hypothetical protein